MGANWLLELESVHYKLLYSFDWNQLAFAIVVSNLIVSRCFRYHEIDNLGSLFYVHNTIDVFSWHYYMNSHHMLHM